MAAAAESRRSSLHLPMRRRVTEMPLFAGRAAAADLDGGSPSLTTPWPVQAFEK